MDKLDRKNLKYLTDYYENIVESDRQRKLGIINVDFFVEVFIKITANESETKIILEKDDKIIFEGIGEIEGIVKTEGDSYFIKFNENKYEIDLNPTIEYQEYNENYFIEKEIIKNTPIVTNVMTMGKAINKVVATCLINNDMKNNISTK